MRKYPNLFRFISQYKIILAIFGVSLVMLLVVILIPSNGKNKSAVDYHNAQTKSSVDNSKQSSGKNPSAPQARSPKSSSIISKIFPWLNKKTGKNLSGSGYIVQKYPKNSPSSGSASSSASKIRIIKVSKSNGTAGNTSGITGSQQSAGATSPGNTSQISQADPASNTNVQIYFKDAEGNIQTYIPPADGSTSGINWVRYINLADGYEIDIPDNWQIVKTQYNGHEGVILYPPGVDINTVNVQSISFVPWQLDYLITSATYVSPVRVNGVMGNVYTKGPMPTSSVAAVFQHAKEYFALGSSASDPTFLGVFDHMLRSIVFTGQ